MLNLEGASKVLEGFMGEMREWETNFLADKIRLVGEGLSTSDCNKRYTDKLSEIYDKYVEGDSITKARLELPGASSPAMYDPLRDNMLSAKVARGKAVIEVNQVGGLESSFRFTLVNYEGRWKIARKDTFRGGKWERSHL
jgi:hypothetical protein